MKIEAGKYYRTRGGRVVVGPLIRMTWCKRTFGAGNLTWKEDGSYVQGTPYKMDLISEVHVSDTPQVNTTKTARDELVEKAALAILNGCASKQSSALWHSEIWLMAEQFVEARKK
jgi:hypothetical protein